MLCISGKKIPQLTTSILFVIPFTIMTYLLFLKNTDKSMEFKKEDINSVKVKKEEIIDKNGKQSNLMKFELEEDKSKINKLIIDNNSMKTFHNSKKKLNPWKKILPLGLMVLAANVAAKWTYDHLNQNLVELSGDYYTNKKIEVICSTEILEETSEIGNVTEDALENSKQIIKDDLRNLENLTEETLRKKNQKRVIKIPSGNSENTLKNIFEVKKRGNEISKKNNTKQSIELIEQPVQKQFEIAVYMYPSICFCPIKELSNPERKSEMTIYKSIELIEQPVQKQFEIAVYMYPSICFCPIKELSNPERKFEMTIYIEPQMCLIEEQPEPSLHMSEKEIGKKVGKEEKLEIVPNAPEKKKRTSVQKKQKNKE